MISNFRYISENSIELKVNLGINVTLFEGNSRNDISAYYKNESSGIRWSYEGKEITVYDPGLNLKGYPSADLTKVIIIYPYYYSIYSSPKNAVIYNGNGSIYMQLTAPKPISDLAMKQRRAILSSDNPLSLYFDNVRWAKNSKGEIITAVQIGFDRDWLEARELNTESGEFGECLSSGRR